MKSGYVLRKYTRHLIKELLLIIAILYCIPVQADSEVKFHGTLVEVNCEVNSNQPITAEFGTIQINELSNATANVPVSITCDVEPEGTVSVAIVGTGTSFNSQALQTDVSGLGITLTSPSTTLLDLNTYYDVTTLGLAGKTGSFNLTAHLLSDGITELKGGEFNATATLAVQIS